ncbi:hypothetical protein BLOT_007124 [Blomia tropicalis]|nr:hypothetical protein BLOT_007124 [Blomia tropicalis]
MALDPLYGGDVDHSVPLDASDCGDDCVFELIAIDDDVGDVVNECGGVNRPNGEYFVMLVLGNLLATLVCDLLRGSRGPSTVTLIAFR